MTLESRAEYFRERRKTMKQFSVLSKREKVEALETKLKEHPFIGTTLSPKQGVCWQKQSWAFVFNNESGELPFLNRYVFFPGFFQIIKYNMYLCCREKCILSRQKYLVIMNESF